MTFFLIFFDSNPMFILEGMTAGRNYCWLKSVGATTKNPYGGMGGEGKAFSAPGKGSRKKTFLH